MTDAVKTLFVNFAVCSVLGGVLEYLTPTTYRKTLRVAVVGVILAMCISPVFKIELSSFDIGDSATEEQLVYDSLMHTANLTEKNVRQQIKNVLIKYGVNEYEIYVTTSVDKENKTVYLKEVVIEVDKSFQNMLPEIIDDIPTEYKSIVRTGVKNE